MYMLKTKIWPDTY